MSLTTVLMRAISVLEGHRTYQNLVSELRKELQVLERREEVRQEKDAVRVALEGEEFYWMEGGEQVVMRVREKSPGEQGRWWCIACGVAFEHNLQKDVHCQSPAAEGRKLKREFGDATMRHVLAWSNFATGMVEEP